MKLVVIIKTINFIFLEFFILFYGMHKSVANKSFISLIILTTFFVIRTSVFFSQESKQTKKLDSV